MMFTIRRFWADVICSVSNGKGLISKLPRNSVPNAATNNAAWGIRESRPQKPIRQTAITHAPLMQPSNGVIN